jgi:hypothetical protein
MRKILYFFDGFICGFVSYAQVDEELQDTIKTGFL